MSDDEADIGQIGRQRSSSAPAVLRGGVSSVLGPLDDADHRPTTARDPPRTAGGAGAGGEDKARAISVLCRFRPEDANEIANGGESNVDYHADGKTVTLKGEDGQLTEFRYHKVFPSFTTQTELQAAVAFPVVDAMFGGMNCSVVAFGQTGSGKTYTMMGVVDDAGSVVDQPGLVPRILTSIFARASELEDIWDISVGINFVELYMEKIQDLLAPPFKRGDDPPPKIEIRDSGARTLFMTNCISAAVTTGAHALGVVQKGLSRRTTAATSMNAVSSRSHAIIILTLTQKNRATRTVIQSQLYMADLAGSEKVAKSETMGMRLEEAKMINKSLFALGQVIAALTTKRSAKKTDLIHIPFRDSKLTRILENSLCGNALTFIILTCSPSSFNEQETLSTLRFGAKAQLIKTAPTRGITRTAAELEILLSQANHEINELKGQIALLNGRLATANASGGAGMMAFAVGSGASAVLGRRAGIMTSILTSIVRCPLSGKMFRDPVFCLDGHTYERREIHRHLLENDLRSPITGERVNALMVVPNYLMRATIAACNDDMLLDNDVARTRSAFDIADVIGLVLDYLPANTVLEYSRVNLTFARAAFDKNRWVSRINSYIESIPSVTEQTALRTTIKGMTVPAHKIYRLLLMPHGEIVPVGSATGIAALTRRLQECQYFPAATISLFSSTLAKAGGAGKKKKAKSTSGGVAPAEVDDESL